MKTWIKLYTEILDDADIGMMPLEMIGMWTMFLALAGKIDDRDESECETGKLDTAERISWHLRYPVEQIRRATEYFIALGMAHEIDGIIYLTNYPKRQAQPLSSHPSAVRERVQRYRDKSRIADKLPCNATETCDKSSSNIFPSTSTSVSESPSVLSSSSSSRDGEAFRAWEKARKTMASPLELEQLGLLVDDYGVDAVLRGIDTSVIANKRERVSLNFLTAILERQKATGDGGGVLILDPGGVT